MNVIGNILKINNTNAKHIENIHKINIIYVQNYSINCSTNTVGLHPLSHCINTSVLHSFDSFLFFHVTSITTKWWKLLTLNVKEYFSFK